MLYHKGNMCLVTIDGYHTVAVQDPFYIKQIEVFSDNHLP